MLSVKIDTGFSIEIDFPISSFARRMCAWIVDVLIWFTYIYIVQQLLHTTFRRAIEEKEWVSLLFGLPVLFYYPLSEIIGNGQTLGKKLFSIRVITTEGGQANISQYLLRWIFRMVDFPFWIFGLIFTRELPWYCSLLVFSGISCVLLSPKSQRVGDILAGTIVIDTRRKTSWEDTVFTEVGSNYKPLHPQVMKLSDKDINSLKTVIENTIRSGNHDIAFRIAERIKLKFNMHSNQDALDFLETLLKDYNYYTAG